VFRAKYGPFSILDRINCFCQQKEGTVVYQDSFEMCLEVLEDLLDSAWGALETLCMGNARRILLRA
jgi:hypothetical protein